MVRKPHSQDSLRRKRKMLGTEEDGFAAEHLKAQDARAARGFFSFISGL
jgi:hypothetical protein